ncbi:hypothetical protein N9X87_00065 [bacterium]|nr:hypothetical protein [bacterium]
MEELLTFDKVQIGAIVALIAVIVQGIKTAFERLEAWDGAPEWLWSVSNWFAHSRGPVVLTVLVSLFAVTLPGIVEDGVLTWPELALIAEALGFAAGANILYWISRLKSPKNIFKSRKALAALE